MRTHKICLCGEIKKNINTLQLKKAAYIHVYRTMIKKKKKMPPAAVVIGALRPPKKVVFNFCQFC